MHSVDDKCGNNHDSNRSTKKNNEYFIKDNIITY